MVIKLEYQQNVSNRGHGFNVDPSIAYSILSNSGSNFEGRQNDPCPGGCGRTKKACQDANGVGCDLN